MRGRVFRAEKGREPSHQQRGGGVTARAQKEALAQARMACDTPGCLNHVKVKRNRAKKSEKGERK